MSKSIFATVIVVGITVVVGIMGIAMIRMSHICPTVVAWIRIVGGVIPHWRFDNATGIWFGRGFGKVTVGRIASLQPIPSISIRTGVLPFQSWTWTGTGRWWSPSECIAPVFASASWSIAVHSWILKAEQVSSALPTTWNIDCNCNCNCNYKLQITKNKRRRFNLEPIFGWKCNRSIDTYKGFSPSISCISLSVSVQCLLWWMIVIKIAADECSQNTSICVMCMYQRI